MPYSSLRDFIDRLEAAGRLVRVAAPASPYLEMTEIQTRLLAEGGPAALFENVRREGDGSYGMPVLVNLFSTVERVAWGMDREPHELQIGRASCRERVEVSGGAGVVEKKYVSEG